MTPDKMAAKIRLLIAPITAAIALVASAAADSDAPGAVVMLDRLEGAWVSDGDAFGAPARSDMIWDLALDGQFARVDYRIVMRPGGDVIRTFSGVGYYDRIKGVAGFWADSSGDLHPIRAVAEENALVAHWGAEGGKQGRTRYEILSSGEVEVTDWVLREGEWRQFNKNIFARAPRDQ